MDSSMKGIAIVSKGTEDIAAKEIKEITKKNSLIKEAAVIFEVSKLENLCSLCYKAQSVNRILFLLAENSFKDVDDIKKKVCGIDFSRWLDKNKTFRVSSEIINNGISSETLNSSTGEFIIDEVKKSKKFIPKVDLDNPDMIFFVYVFGDHFYLGIDFSGFSLHKRIYKIFGYPRSLRGTIAYSLLRIADVNKKDTIIDPFCGSGEIIIEAALFLSKFPVNYFNKEKFVFNKFLKFNFGSWDKKICEDKLKIIGYDSSWLYLNNAKKDSKIAGINKLVSLSRLEAEWLDTKFDKASVDKIITQVPQISKNKNIKDIEKAYDKLFYNAEFILKKKGVVVIISKRTEELKKYAEKYKFKLKSERTVYSGKSLMKVLVFGK